MKDNKWGYNVKTGTEWCGKPLQMESLHPSQPQRKRSQGHEEARSGWEPESHVVVAHKDFNTILLNKRPQTSYACLVEPVLTGRMWAGFIPPFQDCKLSNYWFTMWRILVFVRNKLWWLWLSPSGHTWVPWHTKLVIFTVIIITANMSVHFHSNWTLEKWVTSSSDTNVFLGQWHFQMQSSCHQKHRYWSHTMIIDADVYTESQHKRFCTS